MKHFCLPLLRDVIKRIDQSEFEGFEYINPLLLSTEESVWRGDQLPHSPTYCLSKLPSQPKKKSQANIERRGGGRAKDRNSGSGLVNKAKQTGGWESFPSCVMLIVLLGYQNLLSWYLWGEMKKLNYEKVFFSVSSFSLVSPLWMSDLLFEHGWFCNMNRELFLSVPAIMNTFQPVSCPWMNMTVQKF